MKKISRITLIILSVLILGTIISFYLKGNSFTDQKEELNPAETSEFYEFAQEIKTNYFPELLIEKIEVYGMGEGKIEGYVELNCSSLSTEEKLEVIEFFADFLYLEYPEHFSKDARYDSLTKIYCFDTEWMIKKGLAQPLLS